MSIESSGRRIATDREGREDFIGQLIAGRYQVNQVLRSGHDLATLLADDITDQTPIVLQLVAHSAVPLGAQMRLEHEAQRLLYVKTPWFQPPRDYGQDGPWLYVATPFVVGETLANRNRRGPRSVAETLAVASGLLSALIDIHRLGALHRAVNPSHVVFDASGSSSRVKLTGFGLATLASAHSVSELTDAIHYYAPEQAGLLDRDLTPSSDLYSVGVVLFECVAGRKPFEDPGMSQLFHKQMTAPVPRLRVLGFEIPRALDELIQRLLRKDPRDRYQSAEAVLADVRNLRQAIRQGVTEPPVVVGSRDCRTTLTEPAFVGRERELELLDRQLIKTRQGANSLVLVESESGGGKTQLLSELAQRAAGQGFWVLRGNSTSDGGVKPSEMLEGIVRNCFERARQDAAFASYLADFMGEHLPALVAARPEFAEVLPEARQSQPSESLGEARIVVAFARLLDALGHCDRPALLLLDDSQWIDDLSLKVLMRWQANLSAARSESHHVMLLAAFRTEEVPTESPIRRLRPLLHVKLAAFEDEDLQRLTESMAGPLPREAIELVCRLSQGSPFMASAVLRGLVESRALVRAPDGWRVEPLALADLQSSAPAAEFLSCRLNLLPEHAKELLTVGAILGKEFNLRLAADLAGQPSEDAIAALDDARDRHLLWVRPDGATCVFVHNRIRATLLERLTPAERCKLHYKAAMYLQQVDPESHFDLAYHFDAAGKSDLALQHALWSAEEARKRHAMEVAEQQYRIAQRGAMEATAATRYRIAHGLGDVMMVRGRYGEAAKLFEQAATLADGPYAQANSLGKLGELAFKRDDVRKATQAFEDALKLLKRRVPRRLAHVFCYAWREILIQSLHSVVPKLFVGRLHQSPSSEELLSWRLLSRLATGYGMTRGPWHVFWAHLRAMNLAERYQPTVELAQVYAEHGVVAGLVGRKRRAIRFVEKSLQMRESLGELWGQGYSLHYHSLVLLSQGRFAESVEQGREAVRLFERTGDAWEIHAARCLVAEGLYRLGNLRGAVDEARAVHQSARALGDHRAVVTSLSVWVRATKGRVPREIFLEELRRGAQDTHVTMQRRFAEGVSLLEREQVDTAVDVFEDAIWSANITGVASADIASVHAWRVTALRQLAESCSVHAPQQRAQRIRHARQALREAWRSTRQFSHELPHLQREAALLASLRGAKRSARRWVERSMRMAGHQRAQYEAALSQQVYGRLGMLYGWEDAASMHEQAEAKLRQLELAPESHELAPDSLSGSTLSLADRFENVLETGRRIASALSEESVFHEVHEAAVRLLRGERCLILRVVDCGPSPVLETVAGDLDMRYREPMVFEALRMGRAFSFTEESTNQTSSDVFATELSVVCAPIFVRGVAKACLYVTQGQVSGFFGHDEERLAGFIATLAGAALENADGFQQLHRLNESLEERIAERTAAAEARAQQLAASNEELERTAAELRAAQAELRSAIRTAEAASEAKSQFLAMVSHEIRTPLNGVIGMTELALASPLETRQENHLKIVRQSAESLLRIINDVLDFSKIEAGKLELECILFDLESLVAESLQVTAGTAAQKQIELVHRVDDDVPRRVFGDPGRLQQILVNLIGNAIKFTERGHVLVDVAMVSTSPDGQVELEFSVEDTGLGIEEDKRETIFESFQQADSSTTRRFGGTGLGLAISSRLVRIMNGQIWVESEVGRGSTFRFTATVALDPDGDCPNEQTAPVELPMRVMIVDEHETRRAVCGQWLTTAGADVILAASDVEALSMLMNGTDADDVPSVILVDGQSYAGGGWALVETLCNQHCVSPTAVLLLAPALRHPDAEHCGALPGVDVLTKPIDRRNLIARLRPLAHSGERFGVDLNANVSNCLPTATSTTLDILLAEDGEVNQMVATGLLEMQGHRVTVVEHGRAAIDAWKSKHFDVILMDLEMPEMDGLQATKEIRRLEAAERRIPIIAMTAHAIAGFEQRCFAAGMDDFVTKPIQPQRLFEALSLVDHQKSQAMN